MKLSPGTSANLGFELGIGVGGSINQIQSRIHISTFSKIMNESIDIHDPNRLTIARGTPMLSNSVWNGHSVHVGEYPGNTDGFICDVSDITDRRTITPITVWGDSMTRGAGVPIREIDFGSILGSLSSNSLIYNRGIGGENITQIKARFDLETSRHNDNTVFWVGHNDVGDASTVVNAVETMIESLGHTRYLVVGPASLAATCVSINNALALAIPDSHYLNPVPILQIESGEVDWASYKIDTVHLNELGSLKIAHAVEVQSRNIFDTSMGYSSGISRTTGTFILAYKPNFDDYNGRTNANFISAIPGGVGYTFIITPNAGINNTVRIQNGYSTDRIIGGASEGIWPMVNNTWRVGVIRYFSGTADVDCGNGRSNPTVNPGVLWNEINTLVLGARARQNIIWLVH
jgi:lysophospholipase L1-like esterase